MFEIYKKDVTIGGKTYCLRPLSGRHLPKLYSVMQKFNDVNEATEGSKASLEALDETTVTKLHSLAFETFKKSYPDTDADNLDEWISQNLLLLLEALITVNINSEEIEKQEDA